MDTQQNIYAIYDSKAMEYSLPLTERTDAHMVRAWGKAVLDPEHHYNIYAGDFSLHRVGTYNRDTAQCESHAPELIIAAHELLAQLTNEITHRENQIHREASQPRAITGGK